MIILQSPKVIAALTIMIITTTVIMIITTKIRAITTIDSIDFTRISHHLVLHTKSAPVTYFCFGTINFAYNSLLNFTGFWYYKRYAKPKLQSICRQISKIK